MIPQIKNVQIKNYKSLANISVDLEPFTILVGRNGTGKSNFIDALSFITSCLYDGIDLALQKRGGIESVRRISKRRPPNMEIKISITLTKNISADYSFEIAAKQERKFEVAKETCVVRDFMKGEHRFEVEKGEFKQKIKGISPKISPDRLALYAASATEEFRPVYDFLTSMRFYSIDPLRLREPQDPDPGDFLKSDGSNAAAVLKRLKENQAGTERYERLCRLLSKVADGIKKIEYKSIGKKETIQFRQEVEDAQEPWPFDAANMSDGTLRVLGLLLAVFQKGNPTVIAIEEPEATVHPAITEMVAEVLLNASKERQIIVTTHSPDFLDYKEIKDNQIRVVTIEKGKTLISNLSKSTREVIRKHLYTPGELLKKDELNPDLEEAKTQAEQARLFGNSSSSLNSRK